MYMVDLETFYRFGIALRLLPGVIITVYLNILQISWYHGLIVVCNIIVVVLPGVAYKKYESI